MKYLECEVDEGVVEVQMMRLLGWLMGCWWVNMCACGDL